MLTENILSNGNFAPKHTGMHALGKLLLNFMIHYLLFASFSLSLGMIPWTTV